MVEIEGLKRRFFRKEEGKKKEVSSRLNGERSIGGRTIPEDRSSRRFSHE